MIRRTFKLRSKHICIRRDHIRMFRMHSFVPGLRQRNFLVQRRTSNRQDLELTLTMLGISHATTHRIVDLFFPVTPLTPSGVVEALQQIQPLNAQAPQNPDTGTGTPPGTMQVDITTGEIHTQAGTTEHPIWLTEDQQTVFNGAHRVETRRPIRRLVHTDWALWPIITDDP